MFCDYIFTKKFLLLWLVVFQDVTAVYYWKISDEGNKIIAVQESPYELAYPGSLVDFLHQWENMKLYGKSMAELKKTIGSIEKREKMDDPKIEEVFRKKNKHCVTCAKREFKMDRYTFSTSYTAEACPEFKMCNINVPSEQISTKPPAELLEPKCTNWHEFGLLKEMNENAKWYETVRFAEIVPDPYYEKLLLEYFPGLLPDSFDRKSTEFGHILAQMLSHQDKKISNRAYVHMAAAAYWRVNGKLDEAFKCYRTAAGYISKKWEPDDLTRSRLEDSLQLAAITLMNKGNEYGHANTLINYFKRFAKTERGICTLFMLQGALGDINTILDDPNSANTKPFHQFETALSDFNEALILEKKLPLPQNVTDLETIRTDIEAKFGCIACDVSFATELERQKVTALYKAKLPGVLQENLEKLVDDKLYFNEVYGKQIQIEQQILGRMAPSDVRKSRKISFELARYGYNPHRDCYGTITKRYPYSNNPANIAGALLCDYDNNREQEYEEYILASRKKTMNNRPPINESSWRVAELFTPDRTYGKKLQKLNGQKGNGPQLTKQYPVDQNKVRSFIKEKYWWRADWPSPLDCQVIRSTVDIFDARNYPQVFIAPDVKGFLTQEYLTTMIGLEFNEDHPLPWRQPFCKPINIAKHELSTFDGMHEVIAVSAPSQKYAETRLKSVFVRLAGRVLEEAEVAQRIKTLVDNDIGPRWLGLNLAALYWRIHGYPKEAAYCIMNAIYSEPGISLDLSLSQLSQVLFKVTGRRSEALHMLRMGDGVDNAQPMVSWLSGRLSLLGNDVDQAIRHLKDAVDRDPFNEVVAENLLKVACSGKSSKPAISSQFPTVCCSSVVQNAVCLKRAARQNNQELCYVVDPERQTLVYNRCNGVYTGVSYATDPYANVVSPFLPIFESSGSRRELPVFVEETIGIESIETEELPLDYGGADAFFVKRPAEWWTRAKNEMRYTPQGHEKMDKWEIDSKSSVAAVPPKPLSFLWINDKKQMLDWDVPLPDLLPAPSLHQIRRGLSKFPPPRQTQNMCNGVNKLPVLLDQVSTWVSVTAKGLDIEKYVDLRGPVPGIAGLQPICPTVEKTGGSPLLGLSHIPAAALSDQFLFYKPEKMLTDALKSLGNERDSIEHVAARLHTALMADNMRQIMDNQPVNWLICVLSSLYWRVVGDAPRAVGCLQCALQTAPPQMRDVALVSLANVCHQAGLLHSALIVAGAALNTSPNLVAIHFTIANIYASIGDYQRALEFYYSTLSFQTNFEPARERIRAIYCHSGETFTFQGV